VIRREKRGARPTPSTRKRAGRLWRFFRALHSKGRRRFFHSTEYLARHFDVNTRTIRRWRAELIARGLLSQISRQGHLGKFPEFELTPIGQQPCPPRLKSGARSEANPPVNSKRCPAKMSARSPGGSSDVHTDPSAVVDGQRQRTISSQKPEMVELVRKAIGEFRLDERVLPLSGRVLSPGVPADTATVERIAEGLGTTDAYLQWFERIQAAIELGVMRTWGLAVVIAREIGNRRRCS
jgi:hypothetical protein